MGTLITAISCDPHHLPPCSAARALSQSLHAATRATVVVVVVIEVADLPQRSAASTAGKRGECERECERERVCERES